MHWTTRRKRAHECNVLGTAIALLVAVSGLTPLTGEPAQAAESAPSFERTFEPFVMNEAQMEPAAAAVRDADARFSQAPVEAAPSPYATGMASYYGARFAGRRTASGETFDPLGLTAAHRTLPFGTLVQVTNPRNGRSVVVRINDRGPFTRSRVIDLSRAAADQIGLVRAGHGAVELALIES